MAEQTLVCPHCGKRIPVSKALTHQIETELRETFAVEAEKHEREAQAAFEKKLATETSRLEKEVRKKAEQAASAEVSKIQKELAESQKREKATQAGFERRLTEEKSRLEKQARKAVEEEISAEMAGLQKQLREKDKQVAEAQKQKADVQKLQNQLATREKAIETEIARKIEKASRKAEEETAERIEAEHRTRELELEKKLSGAKRQVAEAQKQKADVQKLQNQLATREKAIETEIARKVEKASRKAEEETAERIEGEHRTHELELEKKLSDAKGQAAELKRKLEQSSQQAQGEVIELKLEKVLKKAFPDDKIEPIAKGKAGADVLQKVYTSSGQYCGAIIWESKNTQNWSKAWLVKLRGDQRRAKAELAVLISVALPKDVRYFAQVDGIWVTEFSLALGLATALRTNLIQVAVLKQSSKGKHEKMELLYEYLSSTEFRHRIEAIVESFRSMQDDLDKERETMERQWAKREKQIQLVVQNVSGMYGDMQAIAGQSLPKIRRLELPAPSA